MVKRATPAKGRVLKSTKKAAAAPPPDKTNKPEADREAFHFHVGNITRQRDKVDLERKELKARRRAAMDAGVNLHDLDMALRMADQEPETAQATIKRMATYVHWMGLAPGVQADLFNTGAARMDEESKAEDDGYVSGLEGHTAIGDRYDAGNPIGQARLRGWNKGQDVIKARFMEKQETAGDGADQPQD